MVTLLETENETLFNWLISLNVNSKALNTSGSKLKIMQHNFDWHFSFVS